MIEKSFKQQAKAMRRQPVCADNTRTLSAESCVRLSLSLHYSLLFPASASRNRKEWKTATLHPDPCGVHILRVPHGDLKVIMRLHKS